MMTDRELMLHFGGRARVHNVFDCWTITKEIYEMLRIKLFDIHIDGLDERWAQHGENFIMDNAHHDWLPVDKSKRFDVVAFQNKKGIVFHIGVMLDKKRFIHCTNAGVAISRLSDDMWSKRFAGFYRHKGRV